MTRAALAAIVALLCAAGSQAADESPIPPAMAWAYWVPAEAMPFIHYPAEATYHVAGSTLSLTGDQLNKAQDPIDWLPGEHPSPPDLVAHGDHAREIEACGGCHGLNGQGFLAVPNIGGLPAGYIAEQLREFAAGRRHSASPERPGEAYMAGVAGKLSAADIKAVSDYFSAIRQKPLPLQVTETETVPRTLTHHYGWQELLPEGGTEPQGRRVILVAEDFPQMWTGDPHAAAIAYVPLGAIERGRRLAQNAAQPCGSCHGADLKGKGSVPPLAGRNPHYLARQLWDIKSGARSGPAVALMQKPAGSLSADQIVDLVAYLASRNP